MIPSASTPPHFRWCWWFRFIQDPHRGFYWFPIVATGAGAVGTVSAASGHIVFSGFSDNSLTSRVSAIDAGYTTTGDVAIFTTDNTTRFLFVQGGATDLVVKLADDNALTAGGAEINISGSVMGFGD